MENKKKDVITDKEIEIILDIVLEEFRISMEQVDVQKKHLVDYLFQKRLLEPARILEKSFSDLKRELINEIKMKFPNKVVVVRDDKSLFEISEEHRVIREEFSKEVEMSYQKYVMVANNLLIDMVNDLKGYFPDDFNQDVYLETRTKNGIKSKNIKRKIENKKTINN